MIILHELSRDAYMEILLRMPSVIKEVEQEYDTVTIELKPATDIETNNLLKYVIIKHGTKQMSIDFKHIHYITVS